MIIQIVDLSQIVNLIIWFLINHWLQILQFLLSLSLLVLIHEFGHFILAKIFKVRVEKFFVFFDLFKIKLFSKKIGDTEYGVGWLPLGGYVKLSGMIDESMDKEQMKRPPQPWEFRTKPAWQRLLIMLGGIMMNIILAFVIYIAIIATWGTDYLPAKEVKQIAVDSLGQELGLRNGDYILSVNGKEVERFSDIFTNLILDDPHSLQVLRGKDTINIVLTGDDLAKVLDHGPFFSPRMPFVIGGFMDSTSVAQKAGLKIGDRIIAINGQEIEFFDQARPVLQKYKDSTISLTVLRSGDTLTFSLHLPQSGLLGVYADTDLSKYYPIRTKHYSLSEAIPAGIKLTFTQINSYLKQFKLIFNPETKAYKSVGTFITIGNLFPKAWDWHYFWNITAFLSIVLAIVNLLPIPGLDGGHALFALWEIITGRKPSDKFLEYAQMVGLAIIFMLFLLAMWNDLARFVFKIR